MGERRAGIRAPGFRAVAFVPGWVVRWPLWRLSRRVLSLVIAVHLATIASVLGTARLVPVTGEQWFFAAVLAVLGFTHLEFSRNTGPPRSRDRTIPYHDLKTVWNAAGLLLLPPVLATLLIISTHTYGFWRIHRRRDDVRPHRWAYSCATVVLGSQAAALVLAAGLDAFPRMPQAADPRAWFVVFAALFVRWLVNYVLIIIAGLLSSPSKPFAQVFARLGEQANEVAACALAVLLAVSLENGHVILLVCVCLVVGVLQQTSYYHYWKWERPFDPLTGLYSRESLLERARKLRDRGEPVGCLLLDLDFFKRINDTHGHNVGDRALVAVADVIRREVRDGRDIPARWGGEEFVVLVPAVGRDELNEIAERIRLRVSATKVTHVRGTPEARSTRSVTMTVSIGAALFPDPGGRTDDAWLLDLIERADEMMYAAKAAGRDQVRTAGVHALRAQHTSAPPRDLPPGPRPGDGARGEVDRG